MSVNEGVNKSSHPIRNPFLLVTEPRKRDNTKPRATECVFSETLILLHSAHVRNFTVRQGVSYITHNNG
jgi:hypothetical protein